jgi:hypothetical protein
LLSSVLSGNKTVDQAFQDALTACVYSVNESK